MLRMVEHLLQPTGLLWITFWAAAVILFRRRQFRWSGVAVALAVVLWVVGATPLPAKLLADLERPYAELARHAPVADAVVMLGGTHDYSPRTLLPMNFGDSVDRVTTALELIRTGKAPVLVLGGAYYRLNGEQRADSELLVGWLRDWQLPTGELIRLGTCADTRDEAARVARIAQERGWRRILLVTTASHLRRAVGTFAKHGLDVVPIGCDFKGLDAMDEPRRLWKVVPEGDKLAWFQTWFHEIGGWWWYRLKGWV